MRRSVEGSESNVAGWAQEGHLAMKKSGKAKGEAK